MAASVRNIVHHKQTIERIRRDIAVIKEQYLPAQEPVLHKKIADVHLQIKMAQVPAGSLSAIVVGSLCQQSVVSVGSKPETDSRDFHNFLGTTR